MATEPPAVPPVPPDPPATPAALVMAHPVTPGFVALPAVPALTLPSAGKSDVPAAVTQTSVQKLKGGKCVWGTESDKALVTCLKTNKRAYQSGSGWKPQVWAIVADAVNAVGGPGAAKTGEKCHDHWSKALKKGYKDVQKLRSLSGFGWDDKAQMVTADERVWDDYTSAHPSAEHWRRHPFPCYDDIHEIVTGVVATGAAAFHPGQASGTNPGDAPSLNTTDVEDDNGSISTPSKHEDDDNPFRGDLTPSSPTPNLGRGRKRGASSEPPSVSAKKSNTKGRRNADVAGDMVAAVHQLASAFGPSADPSSPHGKARKHAMEVMQDDNDFSSEEESNMILLISKDTNGAISQVYTSTRKKKTRTAFLRKAYEDFMQN
ncbi:unnamed protein product [Mycena citricolor]|uniref:Myb-like domain-containing protein n=1 Tax=Mycena citricolor TaxID=2018698 RepID=A0AAD2K2C1_9AGAR|nr:unnamed protein product [Mycena citricolor]